MNYGRSPYTPEGLEILKMNINEVRKKSLIQASTGQSLQVVEKAIFNVNNEIKGRCVLKTKKLAWSK